ncbi:FAD-dependent oxidoreductase [Streptomyces aureoverticillatus]|uniref:FAD-dependent oxidoreductase n=1 Tax=Streptomyces aureoverticillatus TaxID=66871 RepID=UPI0013DD7C90|nr:FAD-dependent oxidoreductase [Streptomyces aureoverticillatus]QIB42368.1 NAD(P)/FAD-dependent oxidoreductase [Streptomyces aureoverticillatus]
MNQDGTGLVTRSGSLPTEPYDVTVVGAGVVGAALARELARYRLRVAVVESSDDVGEGTSKANTAILHTGFDAVPGSLEARLVREGQRLLSAYAAECGIPVERVGALLVAWDEEQLAALPGLLEKAGRNGHDEAALLDAAEVRAREPHLGPGALGALEVPGESIICPWTTPLAFATQAVRSGVDLHLNCRLTAVGQGDAADGTPHTLRTSRGDVRTRYLVNAAGLGADTVDRMLGHDTFTVTPRRGQLIVFDKLARDLVRHILLPVPTALGKGVLVAPTVYGNVLLGPTAEDLDDKQATGSTAEGLAGLREKGARILPELLDEDVTAVYAGLRAATEDDDYQIHARPGQRYVTVGGIRSTGLTASMAIAAYVTGLLADCGLDLGGEPRELAPVTMPNLGENFSRPYQRAELIAADPEYGALVCHCERVTRGEIRDALVSTVPPGSLDGLRRRTRARGGRCQGFYCGAAVRELFDRRDRLAAR